MNGSLSNTNSQNVFLMYPYFAHQTGLDLPLTSFIQLTKFFLRYRTGQQILSWFNMPLITVLLEEIGILVDVM